MQTTVQQVLSEGINIMFVCSSDQGRTVIPTVKSFIKLINQIKSNQSTIVHFYK